MITNKNTLAVDYGTKRIGIAITHGSLAEPLMIVANNLIGKTHDSRKIKVVSPDALNMISMVCEENNVEHIIVGISENTTAKKTKVFVKELKKHLNKIAKEKKSEDKSDPITIELFDETLSSQEVHKRLSEKGIKKKKRQSYIDHFAAAVILEEWLEVKGSKFIY